LNFTLFFLSGQQKLLKKNIFFHFLFWWEKIFFQKKLLHANFTTIIFCRLCPPSSVIQYWRGFQKI